jgi:hypothetical protein
MSACCGSLSWTVPNNLPQLQTPIVRVVTYHGSPFVYTVPSSTFLERDGEVLDFVAEALGPDGEPVPFPAWLSFSPLLRCVGRGKWLHAGPQRGAWEAD